MISHTKGNLCITKHEGIERPKGHFLHPASYNLPGKEKPIFRAINHSVYCTQFMSYVRDVNEICFFIGSDSLLTLTNP